MRYAHTHRYRRVKTPNSVTWRCILPGCRHYLRPEFAEGQVSNCYRCGNDFILNKRNMKLETPHCDSCTDRRARPDLEAIKELMSKKVS